jgi:hypothetical protein
VTEDVGSEDLEGVFRYGVSAACGYGWVWIMKALHCTIGESIKCT